MIDLSTEYTKIGESSALVRARAELARRYLDQKLSVYMAQAMSEQEGLSAAKADVIAKSDPRYLQDLKEMRDVICEAEKAKAKMNGLKMKHEYQRSANSLKKAEMKLI